MRTEILMNRFLTAIATVILIMVFAFSCKKSDTANDGGSSGGVVEPQHYSISVLASPADGGIVTGGGDFEEGRTCTVTASPDFVYVFTNWTENDTIVSDSVSYTFEVTCNRNLVANFALPTYVDAPYNAWDLLFSSEGARMASGLRFLGQSVKAVRSER